MLLAGLRGRAKNQAHAEDQREQGLEADHREKCQTHKQLSRACAGWQRLRRRSGILQVYWARQASMVRIRTSSWRPPRKEAEIIYSLMTKNYHHSATTGQEAHAEMVYPYSDYSLEISGRRPQLCSHSLPEAYRVPAVAASHCQGPSGSGGSTKGRPRECTPKRKISPVPSWIRVRSIRWATEGKPC